MYLQILKKDLKRKKTMNFILLIFITLAAMFIASSANNMLTIATALDDYFEMADVPDYWIAMSDPDSLEQFKSFAKQKNYSYTDTEFAQISPKDVTVSGKKFDLNTSLCLSSVGGTKIFDMNGKEITKVNDGEMYVSSEIFHSKSNDFYDGCNIKIKANGVEKDFTLKGYTKDALLGSSMLGMTRFLISENDLAQLQNSTNTLDSISVYTDDSSFMDQYFELNLQSVLSVSYSGIKLMYIMDMLIAATILIVSICLILISMVILHFTINFTMSEEFREIGVMKAIGIPSRKIRRLYIAKYLAISATGAVIGLILSFPFGNLLMKSTAKNIIISGDEKFIMNIICAAVTALIVVLFCYFCTRKVKKFSPIDAIHNGETGERYQRKGIIHLSRSGLAAIPFMSLNDILSGPKRFISMILIFTLGILLIIIPVNTINTLQSDQLIEWFSMAKCDHVISQDLLYASDPYDSDTINDEIDKVKNELADHNIQADIFQEIMFTAVVSHGEKKISANGFLGTGDVTTEQYSYLKGTAPQRNGEIAISHLVADNINASIGDDVNVQIGGHTKSYTVTAINQSMTNLGESIRFYQDEPLDCSCASGHLGIQIKYTDHPDKNTLTERKSLLKKLHPDTKIYSAGEYISYMIGDAAGQIESIKQLILIIILCINILVAVLMAKSFIAKEKGEIAILKAIGFKNSSLAAWQTVRIGIVLFISILIGTLLSSPLSKLIIEPIFRTMGAYSIKFDIVAQEVYILYPLIVLIVTVFATFLSTQGVRKISSSEVSNID